MSSCPNNPNGKDGRHIFLHLQDIANSLRNPLRGIVGAIYKCRTCGAEITVYDNDVEYPKENGEE